MKRSSKVHLRSSMVVGVLGAVVALLVTLYAAVLAHALRSGTTI